MNLRHFLYVAVARAARSGAEDFDVSHVWEAREARQRVHPDPFRRFPLTPRVTNFLDFGLMRRGRAADQLMAPHARLERRNARLARDRGRVMAIHARDLILSRMNVVTKKDWLPGAFEAAGVADDGSFVALCGRRSRGGLLTVRGHRRKGEDQHHDRS